MRFEVNCRYLVRHGSGPIREVFCAEVSPEGRVALIYRDTSYVVWLDKSELESIEIVEKLPDTYERVANILWNQIPPKRIVRE